MKNAAEMALAEFKNPNIQLLVKDDAGTPQGAVISPLLANIYLHPLDELMAAHGYRMVRYADDFVVMCRRRSQAEEALRRIQQVDDARMAPAKNAAIGLAKATRSTSCSA